MSFKPIDAKRDEFRKYLERTGVLEAMSKVFIKLIHHPDRPENAIDYICDNMGSTLHQRDQIENLQKDLEESKDEIAQLKQIIENLKSEKKFTVVNEQSIQQQQESVEECNNRYTLSNFLYNLENQVTSSNKVESNLSEKDINNESTVSTSNDDTLADIPVDVNGKNREIADNEPKKEVGSNLSEKDNNNESTVSTSTDDKLVNIPADVNEKSTEIKDNEPKKEVAIEELTNSELCKKIEETVK